MLCLLMVFTSVIPSFAAEENSAPKLEVQKDEKEDHIVLQLAVPSTEDETSYDWGSGITTDEKLLAEMDSPDDLVADAKKAMARDDSEDRMAKLADEYDLFLNKKKALKAVKGDNIYEPTPGLYLVTDKDGFYVPQFVMFGDKSAKVKLKKADTEEEAAPDSNTAAPKTMKKGPALKAGFVFDEENIEKFTAELVRGAEKQRDGSYLWTPTNANADHRVVYKITYAFSGVGEISPHDVEIRIPKRIIKDRNNQYADYFDVAVAPEDEAEEDTKWVMREEADSILIYNHTEISAGETGTIEASYLTKYRTLKYKDMGVSDAFYANLTVHNENTDVTARADAPPFAIDTTAKIESTNKSDPVLFKKWDTAKFGAAPSDANNYYYIVWVVRTNFFKENTQPYYFTLTDDFEDGDVVKYCFDAPRLSETKGSDWTNNNQIFIADQSSKERYDYVLTRHSKAEFQGKDYTVWNNVTAKVHPADQIDADTEDSDREPFKYTRPEYKRPPGRFYAEKFGQYTSMNSTSLTETGQGIVKDSEDISDYSLTEFRDGDVTVIDNPNLKFYSFLRGYPYPWTLPAGADGSNPADYGKMPVTYEFVDDELDIEGKEQLGPGDYEMTGLYISAAFKDAVFDEDELCFVEAPLSSEKLTSATDLHLFAKKAGDTNWVEIATYSFKTEKFSNLNRNYIVSADNGYVSFKPGVLGYRWTASNPFYYTRVNTYPIIKLFRTEKVLADIGTANKIKLNNTAYLGVRDSTGKELFPTDTLNPKGFPYSEVGMTNTDYIAAVQKVSHIQKYDTGMRTNKAKKQFTVSWRINMEESYLDNDGKHYVYQDGGTFYDLCPEDSTADTSSVQVYKNSNRERLKKTDYKVSVIHNFRKTGRDLMIIKIKEPADCYSFNFDTIHEWEDLKQTTFSLLNSVAYETGNNRIAEGYPDNGGKGKDKDILADLDPDSDATRFIYSQDWRDVDIVTSTSSALNKKVREERDKAYSYKTFTRTNGTYFYRLRMQNDGGTKSRDIILFDSLENYANQEVSSDFHGTLRDVDVSSIRKMDVDAKVYYSTMANMNIYDHNDLNEVVGGKKVWLTEAEIGDVGKAKAIAIDCRKKTDGSNFVLEEGIPLLARLEMKAPSRGMTLGRIPWAYNNVFLKQIEINSLGAEHPDLIHQDYTKIGYKTVGSIQFRKVDEKNHVSGIRGIEFTVKGTSDYGNYINETYESDANGIVNIEELEQGTYEVKETNAPYEWVLDNTTHHLSIDIDGNATLDLKEDAEGLYWENERRVLGDIRIRKMSRAIEGRPSEVITGAEFILSGTSAYGNDISVTQTSGGGGILAFYDIEKGSYTLKETKATDNYINTFGEATVTIDAAGNANIDGLEADSSGIFTVENDYRYHSFSLYKYDAENDNIIIPGTEFRLKGISDIGTPFDVTATTDVDGCAEFEKIEPGTYILTETKAASKYKLDPTERTVTIDADGKVVIQGAEEMAYNQFKITNERLNDGKITITKRWSDGKSNAERPVPKIHLTTTEPDTVKEAYAVYDSVEKSLIFFKDRPGKYTDGQKIGNKTYWNNMENREAPWNNGPTSNASVSSNVETVKFKNAFRPKICEYWFQYFNDYNRHPLKMDLTNLDMSRCKNAQYMFYHAAPTEVIGFESMDLSSLENGYSMFHDAGYSGGYFEDNGITLNTATPNLTNCQYMFAARTATNFVLRNLDFSGCSGYANLFMDNGNRRDTVHITLDNVKAPQNCSNLFAAYAINGGNYELNLHNFDTSNTTNMQSMFDGYLGDNVDFVKNFNVSKCKDFESMFWDAHNIKEIDLSSWKLNEEGDVDWHRIFAGCSSLKKINLSNIDLDKLIYPSFYDFTGAYDTHTEYVDMTNAKGPDQSHLMRRPVDLFKGMTNVRTIDMTGFDASKIVQSREMFAYCNKLENIIGFEDLDFSMVWDTQAMFYDCDELETIDLSNSTMKIYNSASSMFGNCAKLKTVLIPNFHAASSSLKFNSMFYGTPVEYIDLSNGSALDMTGSFAGMNTVKHLNMSHFDFSECYNGQNFSTTFAGMSNLEEFDIRNAQLDKVTNMSSMFAGDSKLKYVVLPSNIGFASVSGNTVTPLTTVPAEKFSGMFGGCPELETIYAPSFPIESNTSVGMFTGCSKLKGGNGTTWAGEPESTQRQVKYAVIDGENSKKGYFTNPSNAPAPKFRAAAPRRTVLNNAAPKLSDDEAGAIADKTASDGLAAVKKHTEVLSNILKAENGNAAKGSDDGTDREYVTDDSKWVKNGNIWTYTFDVFDDEALFYAYEEDLDGYFVFNDSDNPIAINDGEITKQASFVNETAEVGGIRILKSLAGDGVTAFDKTKQFEFNITLTSSNPDVIAGVHSYGDIIFVDGKATVFLKGGDTIEASGIPAGVHYTVTEKNADGFTGALENASGTIRTDATVRVAATNTKNTSKDSKLTLTKQVTGASTEGTFTFTVHLTGLEPSQIYSYGKNQSFTADGAGTANVEVNLKHNGTCSFLYLPEGTQYQIEETKKDGYDTSFVQTDAANKTHFIKTSGSSATKKETLAASSDVTVTFTNNLTALAEEVTDIHLLKKDRSSKAVLSNAEYNLFGVADNGDEVDITKASDSNGLITFNEISDGEYILKEVSAPVGYQIDGTERRVKVVNGHPMHYGRGELESTVAKTENVEDENTFNATPNGLTTSTQVVTIPGASRLHVRIVYTTATSLNWIGVYDKTTTPYAWNSYDAVSGTLRTSNASKQEKTFDVEGDTAQFYYYISNTTYTKNNATGYYAEVTGYDDDKDFHELSISGLSQNADGQFEVFDNSTRSYAIDFDKVSALNKDNKLYGARFTMTKGSTVVKATSDETGHVVFEGLNNSGEWKLREIEAPAGYELDDTEYTVNINSSTGDFTIAKPDGSMVQKDADTYLIANEPAKVKATVEKTVTGGMGAKNRDFTFNISLHNAAPSTTYQINYVGAGRSGNLTSIKTDATGKAEASFTLRNGQKATIADLPYECSLKVVEPATDHIASETAKIGRTTVSQQANTAANTALSTGEITLNGDCAVTFVNTYGEVAPTGIRRTDMLLFALLIAAGAVLAISYRKKRSRNTR